MEVGDTNTILYYPQDQKRRVPHLWRKLLMGRAAREKPEHLAAKLLRIRTALGLSQNELLSRLGNPPNLVQNSISRFEHGVADPSLPLLLKYARLANIYVEVLIDDELDLPRTLPSPNKHEGSKRKNPKSHPTSSS